MSAARRTVIGGTVAALVAADAIAGRGDDVQLLIPERFGGGFLPHVVDGRPFELGARLVELSYDAPAARPASLDTYVPGPHGHRPFVGLVDRFVRELAGEDLIEASPALLSRGGVVGRDFVMTGDLRDLAGWLSTTELASARRETTACLEREGPTGAFAPDRLHELWSRSFGDLATHHLGPTMRTVLVDSLADRMLPGGADQVIGALHRKIWMPLFHPVTMWEAVHDALRYVPDRPMYTVAGAGMGELVARLWRRIEGSDHVQVMRVGQLTGLARVDRHAVATFANGDTMAIDEAVLAADAAEVFRAMGETTHLERGMASLCWVDIPEEHLRVDPTLVFVADAAAPLYRASRSLVSTRPGWVTLTCELDVRVESDVAIRRIPEALMRCGLVEHAGSVRVVASLRAPAFVVPSFANRDAFAVARRSFDELELPVHIAGSLCGFGVDSFNEQVVQGLRAAEHSVPAAV